MSLSHSNILDDSSHQCTLAVMSAAWLKKRSNHRLGVSRNSPVIRNIIVAMIWSTIAAGALLTQSVAAQNMLRFACSQLTVERADPLVNPGQRPSPHTHQIIGGNSFNLTVRPDPPVSSARHSLTCCRWSPASLILQLVQPVHPARIARTSATTGLPRCTSNPPRTVLSSVYPNSPT